MTGSAEDATTKFSHQQHPTVPVKYNQKPITQ